MTKTNEPSDALTVGDVDDLIEAIDHFIIGNSEELARIWTPTVAKLRALRIEPGQVQREKGPEVL